MRYLLLLAVLSACGGCEPPPCERPNGAEWCLLSDADGGVRVVGSP